MKNTERPRRPRKEESDKSFSPRADKRSDKKSFSGDSRPFSDKKSASSARPKGNFPKKDGFERSFVEPRFGERRPFGDKKPFTSEPSERPFEKRATDSKRPFGDKKPFAKRSEGGFDKDRSFGDKKPYGGDRPFGKRSEGGFDKDRSFGDKKPYGNDRPFAKRSESGFDKDRSFGDKKPYGGDRPFGKRSEGGFDKDRSFGDKKSYGGDRPFAKRSEGGFDKDRSFGDKKPYSGDRPFAKRSESGFDKDRSFGDKKPYGGDRPFAKRSEDGFDKERSFGDKKPYGGDRPFAKRSEDGFDKERSFGDKKPYGSGRSDRPFIKRIEGGFDKDRSFDDNESSENERIERSFSNDKPRFDKRDDNRRERGYSRDGKGEKRENQATSSKSFAPNYNLEKMKSSLPARVQRKVEKEEKDSNGLIRLNRYISNAGIASRRDADELIASGQITVNGKTITEMGYKVKPNDVVKYGKKILNREKLVYILLNKPKDFITTTEDPNERKTVMDLVANACEERVYPVGRLDRNTTGLLLLTNDGELAEKLSHPSNEIRKIYQVELDKPITDEHFEAIKAGVELEDGFIKADDLGLVTPDAEVVGIEIHSGKNRIVRRIFEHFGYEVLKLDRTTYAGLNKKDLPRSKWRFLTEKEVIRLKYMI